MYHLLLSKLSFVPSGKNKCFSNTLKLHRFLFPARQMTILVHFQMPHFLHPRHTWLGKSALACLELLLQLVHFLLKKWFVVQCTLDSNLQIIYKAFPWRHNTLGFIVLISIQCGTCIRNFNLHQCHDRMHVPGPFLCQMRHFGQQTKRLATRRCFDCRRAHIKLRDKEIILNSQRLQCAAEMQEKRVDFLHHTGFDNTHLIWGGITTTEPNM